MRTPDADQQPLTCPGCQRATRAADGEARRLKRTGLPVTPERTEENRRTLEAFLRRRRARLTGEGSVAA